MARREVASKQLSNRDVKIRELAGQTATFLRKALKTVKPHVLAWYRLNKAEADKTPPDWAAMIAWDTIAPIYAAALLAAGQQAGQTALEQVGGKMSDPLPSNVAARVTFPTQSGPQSIPEEEQAGLEGASAGDYIRSQAQFYANYRSAQMVGMTYNDAGELVPTENADLAISDSTRDMIQQDIEDAINSGMDEDALAELLEANYAFSPERAANIAQYELDTAHMGATLAGWTASGKVIGKRSEVSEDHYEDDVCDDNEAAGVIPLAAPFPSGDYGYPFHLRCQCSVIAVYDDGQEEAA